MAYALRKFRSRRGKKSPRPQPSEVRAPVTRTDVTGNRRRCPDRAAMEHETLLVRAGSASICKRKTHALYLDGKNFIRSSWKSTFSSFLHLVFRTRADRRFAVSPLSSEIFFRFTPFLALSPPEMSPSQRVQIEMTHGAEARKCSTRRIRPSLNLCQRV